MEADHRGSKRVAGPDGIDDLHTRTWHVVTHAAGNGAGAGRTALDDDVGTGGGLVEHVEVVLIDVGLDGFLAGVLETVLEYHHGLALEQANDFRVLVGVA